MARSRQSARKAGTAWESAIAEFLRERWPTVERRAKTGAKDKGDLSGLPVVIEAKNCARVQLAQWVDEAEEEAGNAGQEVGVAWVKRRGRSSPGEGYVVMTGQAFVTLLEVAMSDQRL